jgi:hypothetical protein
MVIVIVAAALLQVQDPKLSSPPAFPEEADQAEKAPAAQGPTSFEVGGGGQDHALWVSVMP